MTEQIENENMVLLSASYDGTEKKACLKFYDEKTDTIKLWYDSTEHKPYCLVKKNTDEKLLETFKNEDKIVVEETTKIDLLNDKEENMLKIIEKVEVNQLRTGGLIFALIGFAIIWFTKS